MKREEFIELVLSWESDSCFEHGKTITSGEYYLHHMKWSFINLDELIDLNKRLEVYGKCVECIEADEDKIIIWIHK